MSTLYTFSNRFTHFIFSFLLLPNSYATPTKRYLGAAFGKRWNSRVNVGVQAVHRRGGYRRLSDQGCELVGEMFEFITGGVGMTGQFNLCRGRSVQR